MTFEALDGALWRKSTHSGSNNNCVEHTQSPTGCQAVRDTKDRSRAAVVFAPAPWRTFLDALRT
ncbi:MULTISPECIES: DUF397 domain-containing protein [unclassified Streptomyces]|uniref:DUF397 domain-containing protein n=1 Tax=unclassified Streptomyces TaxID=2593676 RepID=UPI00382ABBF0